MLTTDSDLSLSFLSPIHTASRSHAGTYTCGRVDAFTSQADCVDQAYHSIFLQDTNVQLIGTLSYWTPAFSTSLSVYQSCTSLQLSHTQAQRLFRGRKLTNKSTIGNFPLLPLRTRTRGPAYALPSLPAGSDPLDVDPDSESYDPLDEVLSLFRANTFFRNFEIKGPADRLLIYGILFVSECLGRLRASMPMKEAEKVRLCVRERWGSDRRGRVFDEC